MVGELGSREETQGSGAAAIVAVADAAGAGRCPPNQDGGEAGAKICEQCREGAAGSRKLRGRPVWRLLQVKKLHTPAPLRNLTTGCTQLLSEIEQF